MSANTAFSSSVDNEVTNESFLHGIFGETRPLMAPAVVSFSGHPQKQLSWIAVPWSNGSPLEGDRNNYFSLASYQTDNLAGFQRKKDRFLALHALTLDDIGGKVDRGRVTLQPSWIIETSSNNFQYGYIFRVPIEDIQQAEELANAIIKAELTDPGNDGPATRLARLPVGVNGKYVPSFICNLTSWRPDLTYTPDEIIEGLELERFIEGRSSTDDALVLALKSKGLYREHGPQGKHHVTCPWASEHRGSVDPGATYFEPNDTYPEPLFRCHHPVCKDRGIEELRQVLGLALPAILVGDGQLNQLVDQTVKLLASTGRHFRSDDGLAVVSDNLGTSIPNHEQLTLDLADLADWRKTTGNGRTKRIDPPKNVIQHVLNGGRLNSLNNLVGTVSQPFLRPDGSLVTTERYDKKTQLYASFDAGQYTVPEHPTEADAKGALDELNDILAEFPFDQPHDRSAALAGILTATVRASLPTAPMFHVTANTPGSGKSFLCSLFWLFATEQSQEPASFPSTSDECEKLLLGLLSKSPAVIEFDNLTGDLVPHAKLCTALSSPSISGRILGANNIRTVSTRSLFLSSGNNVVPLRDLTRRVLTVTFRSLEETPALRKFDNPNLLDEVKMNRERYVSLALTIIRAFVESDEEVDAKPFGSYSGWTHWCRKPLIWLGQEDPLISVEHSIAHDPDRETLGHLLRAWSSVFGTTPTRVAEAATQPFSDDHLTRKQLWDVLHEIAPDGERINDKRLGRWITQRQGRIVDGLSFQRGPDSNHSSTWIVERR
jgi:hypothetical protein